MTQSPILTLFHFNDVYDIQPRNKLGGIINFKAKLTKLKQQYPNSLVLFSGDAFSPSILSTIQQGWQMVHCLNTLQIDAACFGNHQFDYKYQHVIQLKNKTNFEWVLGNLKYIPNSENFGQGKDFKIIQKYGMKIGVFGVAGDDWTGILPAMYSGKVHYTDHIQYSNRISKLLKQQYHCNFIIALTHMRNAADCSFPSHVKLVDIVLGGHDHVVMNEIIDSVPVIKSGTNFLNIGVINVYKNQPSDNGIEIGRHYYFRSEIQSIQACQPEQIDISLQLYVSQVTQKYKKFDKVIGYSLVDIDMRFSYHRRNQSAYGNFMADLFRQYMDVDIAFCNSGNVRNDCVLQKGELWFSDVMNVIDDALVVKQLTGKQIKQALEISVDSLPLGTKGSFLQVSGIQFTYSTRRPVGSRIINIWYKNNPINLDRQYSVVMIAYIANGGDGYSFIKDAPILQDQQQTVSTTQLFRIFFQNINYDLVEEIDKQKIQIVAQSQAIQRIMKLQNKLIKSDGKYMPGILPLVQNRIQQIQQSNRQLVTQKCLRQQLTSSGSPQLRLHSLRSLPMLD